MTDDAKELLQLHAKSPDRALNAQLETAWEQHRLDAAYAELEAAGFIEKSATGSFVIGATMHPSYRLTDKGYAASKSA